MPVMTIPVGAKVTSDIISLHITASAACELVLCQRAAAAHAVHLLHIEGPH